MIQPHVFIGIASKRGPCNGMVSDALERVKGQALRRGVLVSHQWETRGDVCIGRALLVQRFRDHRGTANLPPPTSFLSLDDDVAGYTGDDLVRCVESGEDFVSGVVPARSFNPAVLADAVRKGVSPDELAGHLSPMLVKLQEGPLSLYKGHLLPVDWSSLGWTLLSRRAVETMVEGLAPKDRACEFDTLRYPRLFRFTEDAEGHSLDDSTFLCRLWQQCGGTVYVDTEMSLAHFGEHPFLSAKILDRLRLQYGAASSSPTEAPPPC